MPTAVAPRYDVAESVKRAAKVLNLSDTKRLTTALSIVAADAAERNALIAEQIRQVYSALPAKAPRSTSDEPTWAFSEFKPIKHVQGFKFDAAAPIDPYLVYEAYGPQQFPHMLEHFTLPMLKGSALFVEVKHPNTKPANKGKRASVIEYIVRYVTMPEANSR